MNGPFVWSTNANFAFEGLKQTFTSTPILMHLDPMQRLILEANAFDFTLGSILS